MTLDRNRDVGTTDAEIADGDLTVERDTFVTDTSDAAFDGDAAAEDLDPEEIEVAEIRADIEETREEMGGTLRELGNRLEPSHLMDQAKENVREATIGRVEETAKGMSDMVMETIKRNPIPAAMAGAGLALLWMNRSNGSSSGSRDYGSAGYRYGETGRGTWTEYETQEQGIGSKVGSAAGTVGDTVGSAASTVGDTVGSAASTVGQVGQNVGQTVGQTVQGAGTQFDRILQSSPLAVAAVAAGTGAIVGALIPETQGERQMLGSAGQQIGTAVRDTVSQAADKAEEQLDRAAVGSGTSS
jgi:hypothetical protein